MFLFNYNKSNLFFCFTQKKILLDNLKNFYDDFRYDLLFLIMLFGYSCQKLLI